MSQNGPDFTSEYNTEEEWLSPREAATYMGVSVRSIYAWVERGLLEATRDKRQVRVNRAALELMQQQRHIRKVAGEVVDELGPQVSARRQREVSSAVFVALAGLQSERQGLIKQLGELHAKVAKDAYTLGQLDEKLVIIGELEELITYLRKETARLQETNQKLTNLVWVFGLVLALVLILGLGVAFMLIR